MFSGIIEERAAVASLIQLGQGARLTLESHLDLRDSRIGDSFAVDGVCLTLTSMTGSGLSFDIGSETMRRSTLGNLRSGEHVNLERSLRLDSRIHGHLVSGHVDGMARLIAREDQGQTVKLTWEFPPEISAFIAPKGAVCLSGVSLTVGEVAHSTFSVYIIPHTLEVTSFKGIKVGTRANIEVDLLARYVCRALGAPGDREAGWLELLRKAGFLSPEQ